MEAADGLGITVCPDVTSAYYIFPEWIAVDEIRSRGFPKNLDVPVFLFRDDAPLKAHPSYQSAKSGEPAAAVQLVMDLANPLASRVKAALSPDVIFVAPHAREAPGDNAIPQVLARAMARATGAEADRDIVQQTRVFHTGADPMERLNNRARFDGSVRPGARYVMVDDVLTMGGTLAELAWYVICSPRSQSRCSSVAMSASFVLG